jgi:hypothetical protein
MNEDEHQGPHCWADGPKTKDGKGTTCMLTEGHEGAHEWTSDHQIVLRFRDEDDYEAWVPGSMLRAVPIWPKKWTRFQADRVEIIRPKTTRSRK